MEKDISRISARRGFSLACFTNICTVKSQSLGETRVHTRVILRKTLPDDFDSNGSSKFFAYERLSRNTWNCCGTHHQKSLLFDCFN